MSTTERESAASADPPSDFELLDPSTRIILQSGETDNRILKRALLVAALFHAVLLVVTFPDWSGAQKIRDPRPSKVFKMQEVRFQPPAAAPKKEIPKRRAKKIPIPDPTPDEPEPIVVEELFDLPEDLPQVDVAVFGIPDAPAFVGEGASDQPMQMGSGITPPVKIHAPRPGYTEEARQARIQGSVILQVIINRDGTVRNNVQVLKGLPLGLDTKAVETVKEWTFKPATQNGEPVSVYFTLILNFSLQ